MMRYRFHWSFKLLALILAVVSGAVLVVGAAGLVLEQTDYYENNRQSLLYNQANNYCDRAVTAVFDRYAWQDTGIEPKLFERFFRWGADVDLIDELEYAFYYSIYDYDENVGNMLESNYNGSEEFAWSTCRFMDVRRGYVTEMPKADYYPSYNQYIASRDSGMAWLTQENTPLPEPGECVTDYEYYVVGADSKVNPQNISMKSYNHADAGGADYTIYRIEYTHYDSYYVEVGLTAEQMVALLDEPAQEAEFLPEILQEYEAYFLPMTLWSGLVLALSCFWLALVAGKSPYREGVKPDGLNRIPLDAYAAAVLCGGVIMAGLAVSLVQEMAWGSIYQYYEGIGLENFFWYLAGIILCGGGCGLLAALLTMACAAQMKVGDNYWLRHTCIGLCWGWVRKIIVWCWRSIKRLIRGTGKICRRFVSWLPLSWQWLMASGILWMIMGFCCIVGFGSWEPGLILLGIIITIPPVLYGAYCFGALRDGAKKMSDGRLSEKLENKYLRGCFGEFAGHLNALGDVCMESANRQMKSERMKTELITNVSHDIKTPLTSIINYVDLLQKTDDEARRAEYLEVLDRQSQKLKKLIEDLMEMSRANSGNVSVEITPTDVCEAVNQALGEYADALESCGLTLMRRTPAEACMALCDGRHLWRVLGNALSNVVKYAMPGTRVYVEILTRDQQVEISIKNISAQMLDVSAEELMERFVRGDSARNTEGNGLGLNIARSLMEVQGGTLDLVVDGDLFKVVLTLESA